MGLKPLISRPGVAAKVKEARLKLGMTQEELARAIDAPESQSQVSLWETGRVTPTEESLEKLASLVGWHVDAFFQYEPIEAGEEGSLGSVLIEVTERFAELIPKEDVLLVMEGLVNDLVSDNGISDADSAAWKGYLRGLGAVRRVGAISPAEAAIRAEQKLEAGKAGEVDADAAPPVRSQRKRKTEGG